MFEQIITYVDIGMWCCILFGILIAFLRGFKRNFNNMLAVITIIILCYIFSPLLAKLISNFDISWILRQPGPISLLSKIKEVLAENLNITVEAGSTLDEYLTALAIAVLNIPVYLFLLFNSLFTLRFLLRLIFKIIPVPKGTSFGGRVAGVGLQLVTMASVLFFGFGILFGVEGLLQDVVEYSAYVEENNNNTVSEEEFNLQKLGEYIEIIDSKPFFKMVSICSGHNHKFEAQFLGRLCQIKTKNVTFNIVKEKDAYLPLIPTIVELSKSSDTTIILNTIIKNRESLINTLKKSNIFEFVMPVASEIFEQKTNIEGINYEELKTVNWKDEKTSILNIVDEILKILDEANFDYSNYKSILANENLSNYLKRIGQKINESNLIKDILIPFGDSKLGPLLDEKLPEELKSLKDVLILSKLNFETDLEITGHVLNDIVNLGLLDNEQINFIAQRETIFDLVDQVFSLSLIQDNEAKIFNALIDYLKLDEKLDEMKLKLEPDNVTDWHNEIENFKELVSTILDIMEENDMTFDNADMSALFNNLIGDDRLKSIITNICHSELLNNSIIPAIDKLLTDANLKEYESQYFIDILEGTVPFDPDTMVEDLCTLVDIMKEAKDLNLTDVDFSSIEDEKLDNIKSLVERINNINLLTIDKLTDYVNTFLENMDYNTRVLSMYDRNNNGSTKDEWSEEIPKLFDIIKKIKNIDMNNESLIDNHSEIGYALDVMKNSYIFGNDTHCDSTSIEDDIFNHFMVETLIKTNLIGTNGFIDEVDADNADWSKYNYTNELAIISHYNFDVSPNEQDSETIRILQDSVIIYDFFDIAGMINSKIEEVEIELLSTKTIKLKDHVNNGEPLTKEDLYNTDWADELDAINALTELLNNGSDDTALFKQGIEDMTNSDKETYAKGAAESIKNDLQTTYVAGLPLWDML